MDVFGEGKMLNDGWNNNRLFDDYFWVCPIDKSFSICIGAYIIVAHTFKVGHSHLTGTFSSSYSNFYGMGICCGAYYC